MLSNNVAISFNVPVNTQVAHQWNFYFCDNKKFFNSVVCENSHLQFDSIKQHRLFLGNLFATEHKTDTYRVAHRLLYDTACLISNLKLHTTLPGQIELSSSLSSPQSFFLLQTLILLIHMPFLHWNSADKQSRGVVGATVVVHVGVGRPMKET